MARLLPLTLLLGASSIFGLAWIVIEVDPTSAPWYIFALFVFLLFLLVFCFLGTLLYFARTRIYRRYSTTWYFKTSFKMAFFIALFLAIAATLAIIGQVTTFNIILAILATVLFALWAYLGKNIKGQE